MGMLALQQPTQDWEPDMRWFHTIFVPSTRRNTKHSPRRYLRLWENGAWVWVSFGWALTSLSFILISQCKWWGVERYAPLEYPIRFLFSSPVLGPSWLMRRPFPNDHTTHLELNSRVRGQYHCNIAGPTKYFSNANRLQYLGTRNSFASTAKLSTFTAIDKQEIKWIKASTSYQFFQRSSI